MGRLGMVLLVFLCFGTGQILAQVVECPGFLPTSNVEKTHQRALAKRLLSRFISVLDLQDIEAVDERLILENYRGYPEQLAIKLSYLSLQCQMVVLEANMSRIERKEAVRRVFLNYILASPDSDAKNLATYVDTIAAGYNRSSLGPVISAIEQTLSQSPKRAWQRRWFNAQSATKPDRSTGADRWSVIVSSPRYEDEGWEELRRHQRDWPDVYFELDGPFDLVSPFYAVVAGRNLSAEVADDLLNVIKAKGMARDAFRWKAPEKSVEPTAPEAFIDSNPNHFRPTPPRPPLNGIGDLLLSQ